MKPRRHPRWRILLAAVPAVVLSLTACSNTIEEAPDESAAEDRLVGHVHGLGVDPADGALYVAGHYGLFRVEDRTPTRVADRWQDTMAFTVSGPRTFLASGHPDLREGLPAHLGLIESTDSGRTWEALSLQGEADFHALEVAGPRLYGYDSSSGRLLTTTDRRNWKLLATGQFADLAALPARPDLVLATTMDQRVVQVTMDGTRRFLRNAPRLLLLATTERGELVGISSGGEVFTAPDPGGDWQPAGRAPGSPTALAVSGDHWYVATDDRVYESTDRGATWDEAVTMSAASH